VAALFAQPKSMIPKSGYRFSEKIMLQQEARSTPARRARARCSAQPVEEMTQMPKMKTKSGAKKRFKITGGGKVLSAHAGKRHGMIKRTNKQIRHHRGTRVLFKTDGEVVKKNWLPNG
jgi:large subunit ribosomal protein L35